MEINIVTIVSEKATLRETVQSRIEEGQSLTNIIEEKRKSAKEVIEGVIQCHIPGVVLLLEVILGAVEVVQEVEVEVMTEKVGGVVDARIAAVQIAGTEDGQGQEIDIAAGLREAENGGEIDHIVNAEAVLIMVQEVPRLEEIIEVEMIKAMYVIIVKSLDTLLENVKKKRKR